jgi:hypothetical protein
MPAKKSSSKRKSRARKYGPAAAKSVERAMHREKRGTLKSGKGGIAEERKREVMR